MHRFNLTDRRETARIFFRVLVDCEIINPKDKSILKKNAIAHNISSEGIYLEMDEPLPLGTEINLTFQWKDSKNIIKATIKVVRTEIIEEEKAFGIGTIFVVLSPKDKEEIKQLVERLDIHKLLEMVIQQGASDLHLTTNFPPVLRINGELHILNMPKLIEDDIPHLIYSLMSNSQIKQFEDNKELTFGYQFIKENRFRINLHQQRGFPEAALRLINTNISSFEDLRIPDIVKDLTRLKEGLILVVGPTGSGKTTTMAAMVEFINQEKNR